MPPEVETGRYLTSHDVKRRRPTDAALLVDLAELLFRLSYQLLDAPFGQFVRRLANQRAILHDRDFEFSALVFVRHGTTPVFYMTGKRRNCSQELQVSLM
jgi:hypothetical protein